MVSFAESHGYECSEVSMFKERMQLQLDVKPSVSWRIDNGKDMCLRETRPNDKED